MFLTLYYIDNLANLLFKFKAEMTSHCNGSYYLLFKMYIINVKYHHGDGITKTCSSAMSGACIRNEAYANRFK